MAVEQFGYTIDDGKKKKKAKRKTVKAKILPIIK